MSILYNKDQPMNAVYHESVTYIGLTKQEHFACEAMKAILARKDIGVFYNRGSNLISECYDLADAFLSHNN